MNKTRFSTKDEFKKILTKANKENEIKNSGIQMMYEGENIYIDDTDTHNLIIGDAGSGKTQSIVLPLMRTSIKAEESFIFNDKNGGVCQMIGSTLKENGYNVLILDFKNFEYGNCWNPFTQAYKLYKEGKKNEGVKLLENIGYYIFNENSKSDPFWTHSANNYFVGLSLYLFKNAKEEEINLNSIFSLSNSINEGNNIDKFLNKIDKNSTIYYNLSGTLTSPSDTRGGIISTFIEKIKKFISNDNLCNMLSYSDFDMTTITKEKTAVFIINGMNKHEETLIPLFVSQIISVVDNNTPSKRRLNIILDDFDDLDPIHNFPKILNYVRTLSIRFTILLRSFISIEKKYGKEVSELIKTSCHNIIYLWSSDLLHTLEEISKLCGTVKEKQETKPLVTIEELKTLSQFEAIILKQRMMPFKTKLLPDWQMKWSESQEEYKLTPIEKRTINTYKIKFNK